MNKRKKASYGMEKKRGGDYMEPNKELKFGAVKGKKPKVKNNRRRAQDSTGLEDIKEGMKNYGKNPSYGNSPAAKKRKAEVAEQEGRGAAVGAGAARRRQLQEETTRNSPNPPASMDPKKGTYVGSQAEKDMKKNPYSEAKKRDANLDSYIKQRNAAEKGSLDYNEAQNKINKAYGKGPTNRRTTYGREKKGENITQLNKRGPAKMDSNAREFTLQTKMTSTKTPTPAPKSDKESKIEARTAKKVGKIQDRRAKATARKEDRADNKNNRSADRQFAKNERQGARADRKQGRMDDRADRKAGRQEAKASSQSNRQMNKEARSIKRDNIKATRAKGRAEKAAARKMEKGGPRKKALFGSGIVGKVANVVSKIAPEGSTVGKIANTVENVASDPLGAGLNVAKNAIQGNKLLEGIGGQQQQPATPAAPAAAPAAAPQAGATGQPVQQQTMKRGGKKKKALKDRRKRGRGR